MEFLDKLNLRPRTIFKVIGLGFLAIIFFAFAFQLIGSTFNSAFKQNSGISSFSKNMAMNDMDGGMAYESTESLGLSARNIAPTPGYNPSSTGDTAEEYEITEYNGHIETRELEKTCAIISSLKSKDYVIFENANEYDKSCNYFFKVKKENKDEILAVIESLDTKDLSENTRTIKRLIDDYTSETEILIKKKESIEKTLNDAINSYDEISRVATRANDSESLSKIIDSKIRIIERLTKEKININTQLDRISRSKADQLDRLDYVNFKINVYENKFIDGELIKDSWKNEIRKFVRDLNQILQNSSIGLIKIIFYIIQFALYIILVVFVAKYGWKILKKIWMK